MICALSVIVVLSIVGAGVLMNCTTRYNATSKQVKGWKEALYAAEAGGDLAYDAIRLCNDDTAKNVSPCNGFASATGWSAPAPSPFPTTDSWALGYGGNPFAFGASNSLSAQVTVDKVGGSTTAPYYRIRSIGTAQISGLKRVGLDDRTDRHTKGDSLLRKIDFNLDHFIATYGFGDALSTDAATTGNGKATAAVMNADKAQVTRRIELVAIPVMPIEAAIKTRGFFTGTLVDSYDSQYGPYAGINPVNSPFSENAHDGDVACGGSTFTAGHIYGDVSTNGGNATNNNISGVVDNNVPFTLPTATPGAPPIPSLDPTDTPAAQITWENGSIPNAINPTATPAANGTLKTTFWYKGMGTSISGLTVNPLKVGNTPIDTTVNLYATSNAGTVSNGIHINKGVSSNLYFRGNISGKAMDFDNFNADGPVAKWDYFYLTAADRTGASGFAVGDLGKIAYQDGNPGTYWTLTSAAPATWATYSVPNPTWPYSSAANVVCRFVPPRWVYANVVARTTATGFAADDVNKFAFQSDKKTYHRLTSITPVTWDSNSLPYEASPKVSRADHLWFYGISPTDGTPRTIDINPPGTMYAAFYAPDFDFGAQGNPDIFGVMVCKTYTMNGNCTFHFDKQLATSGTPLDYRIANYVEDVR